MTEEPLFKSTHAALRFAFTYLGQHSPRTPLMSMIVNKDKLPIGSGKGLSGMDAAAQAGFILAEVCRLPDDQHNFIIAKYHRLKHTCLCCGSQVYSEEWRNAIDALSHCVELEGVHREVRLDMVEKAICGGSVDIAKHCTQYSLGKTTLYDQLKMIKTKFGKLERSAMDSLDNHFINKLLVT